MIVGNKIRLGIIFCAFVVLYVLIIAMLGWTQIVRGSFFKGLASRQYDVIVKQTPTRALIVDRKGIPVATNTNGTSAFILPRQIKDAPALAQFLRTHFPAAYDRWQQQPNRYFLYVKRRLSPAQIKLIEKAELQDIQLVKEPTRYYPNPALSTLIGITDIDNRGLCGLENFYERQLGGSPEIYTLKRDASGHFFFEKQTQVTGHQGADVQLCIDSQLQFLALREVKDAMATWQAKEGGAIIMDPTTGEIIVMACTPDFDPNNTTTLEMANTRNRLVTDAYEAGSVIKVFCAMAALEEGVVTPDEIIDCKGAKTAYVNGFKINTVHGHGAITFSEVIEKSNNIGTATVAMRLGTKIYDHYMRLGFGRKTGIDFPGEQSGFVSNPKNWCKRSIISLSYGYEIRTTMLQIARAFALISNGGRLVYPRLLKGAPVQISGPLYSQRTLDQIREILTKTVSQGTGTKARINGYLIMGKTGTAELIENGHYNANKNLFSFCGIVEKGSYKRVIVAYIKETQLKGHILAQAVSAPLFERIAQKMLIHEKVI